MYHSDFALAKTGFGRAAKAVLSYLYKTNKYEIVQYCCGINQGNPELNKTPWKSIGSLPSQKHELLALNKNPEKLRLASYGGLYLDDIIAKEKPDIYIGVQDIWGLDFAIKSDWFSKINSVIWTTLDSLPILPEAIEYGKKIKNYWIWSDFATKELHKLGHRHCRTMHGPVENKFFFKLPENQKLDLRRRNNIDANKFIVGFVFRNQLRKSVPNLLEGYALWKKDNPNIKNTALLLHTSLKEGWNVEKLSLEYSIPFEEILTTNICKKCKNYQLMHLGDKSQKCLSCGAEDSLDRVTVNLGVTEEQLNEIYNIMDVYCHPFTSGGQEIPIQEAKFAELITLVTSYSCGEDMCQDLKGTIPLDWHEYREHGTEFRKASTDPISIKNALDKVYNMSEEERILMGKYSREWATEKFSIEKAGEKIDSALDSFDKLNYELVAKTNVDIENLNKIFETNANSDKNLLILDILNDIDIFYCLFIPKKINNLYKNSKLYLVVDKKYKNFFEDNPYVEQIIFKDEKYNDIIFLKELKSKYGISNIIKLSEFSGEQPHIEKFNKTNIELNL